MLADGQLTGPRVRRGLFHAWRSTGHGPHQPSSHPGASPMATQHMTLGEARDALLAAIAGRHADHARAIVQQLPPHETLALLDGLPSEDLAKVVALLGDEGLAGILPY